MPDLTIWTEGCLTPCVPSSSTATAASIASSPTAMKTTQVEGATLCAQEENVSSIALGIEAYDVATGIPFETLNLYQSLCDFSSTFTDVPEACKWIGDAIKGVKFWGIFKAVIGIVDIVNNFSQMKETAFRIDDFVMNVFESLSSINDSVSEFMSGLKDLGWVKAVDVAGVELAASVMSVIAGIMSAVSLIFNGYRYAQSSKVASNIDAIWSGNFTAHEKQKKMKALIDGMSESEINKHFNMEEAQLKKMVSNTDDFNEKTVAILKGRVSQTLNNKAVSMLVNVISIISFIILVVGCVFPPGLTVAIAAISVMITLTQLTYNVYSKGKLKQKLETIEIAKRSLQVEGKKENNTSTPLVTLLKRDDGSASKDNVVEPRKAIVPSTEPNPVLV